MKVVLVLLAVVGVALGALGTFKCHQGADAAAAAAAEACEQIDDPANTGNDIDVAACGSPVVAEYTGVASGTFICGACPDNSEDTCKECDADSCNAPAATVEYECPVVAWDDALDTPAFAEGAKTKCQASEDKEELKVCNSAGAKATNDGDTQYVQVAAGCGPCEPAKKTAEICADNSAATITALLLPVIALFYTLF